MAVDDQRDNGLDELSAPQDSDEEPAESTELTLPAAEPVDAPRDESVDRPATDSAQDTAQFDDDALAAALEQQFALAIPPVTPVAEAENLPDAGTAPEASADTDTSSFAEEPSTAPEDSSEADAALPADAIEGDVADEPDSEDSEPAVDDEPADEATLEADADPEDNADPVDDEPHDDPALVADKFASTDGEPEPETEPEFDSELGGEPEIESGLDGEPARESATIDSVDDDLPRTVVLPAILESEPTREPAVEQDTEHDAEHDIQSEPEPEPEPERDDDEPEFDIFTAFDDTAPSPTITQQAQQTRPLAPVAPPAPVIPHFAPVLDFDAILAGAVAPAPDGRPVERSATAPETTDAPAAPPLIPATVQRPLAATPLTNPTAVIAPPHTPEPAPASPARPAPITSAAAQPAPAQFAPAQPTPFSTSRTPAPPAEVTPFEELFGFAEPRTAGIPQATASNAVAATVIPDATGTTRINSAPAEHDDHGGGGARMFWIWFAANASILSVVFGATIFALGMSLRQAIVAVLAGITLSFLPLALTTIAGARSGAPAATHSRAVFGIVGAAGPVLLSLVGRLLWAVILLWLLATTVAGLLDAGSGDEAAATSTAGEFTLVFGVAGLVIACAIAAIGMRAIAAFQLVVTVLGAVLVAGFIGITAGNIDLATALTVPDAPWIMVVTGAVLVFSVCGLLWAGSTTDLASHRSPGTPGSTAFWATAGVTLPSLVLIAHGALLAASDPELTAEFAADPFAALASLVPTWYAIPLVAAAALGLLSGLILVLHSAGLALSSTRWMPRVVAVLASAIVVGVLGAVALGMPDFAGSVRDLVTTIAVPVAAWAGIASADTLLRTRALNRAALTHRGGIYPDVRWGNLAVLVVASLAGFGLTTATVGWLSWQGFLLPAIGSGRGDAVGASDLGVVVALLIGLLVPLISGVAAVRRQEQTATVER